MPKLVRSRDPVAEEHLFGEFKSFDPPSSIPMDDFWESAAA
jgi:hypothetical protein